MKKFLFLCVNYNSYSEVHNFLHSVEKAAQSHGDIAVEVMIADNTENGYQVIDTAPYHAIGVKVFPFYQNLGYLGAVSEMVKHLSEINFKNYQYVIISNVDVLLHNRFFEQTLACRFDDQTAWVAPSIYSYYEKRDRNPSMRTKPTIQNINKLCFMYAHPLLHYIYEKTLYKWRHRATVSTPKREQIYAGHGSFMMFTGSFFEQNRNFKFPVFLFGEELFWAELALRSKNEVVYEPSIKINDIDHISTRKISYRKICAMCLEALQKMKVIMFAQ